MQAEDVEWLAQGTAMIAEEARAVARRTVEALPDALADVVAEAKQEDRISERLCAAGEARKRALQEETRTRCGRMVMMLDAFEGRHQGSGAAGRMSNRSVFPKQVESSRCPGGPRRTAPCHYLPSDVMRTNGISIRITSRILKIQNLVD